MSIYAVSFTFYSLERFNWLVRNEPAPVSVTESDSDSPFSFSLLPACSNPFNSTLNINYSLARPGSVTLKLFDLHGREVTTLVDRTQSAGHQSVSWNAEGMPSGIYIIRLNAGGIEKSSKVVLMK